MKTFNNNQDTDSVKMSNFSEIISIIFVTVVVGGSVIAILFF